MTSIINANSQLETKGIEGQPEGLRDQGSKFENIQSQQGGNQGLDKGGNLKQDLKASSKEENVMKSSEIKEGGLSSKQGLGQSTQGKLKDRVSTVKKGGTTTSTRAPVKKDKENENVEIQDEQAKGLKKDQTLAKGKDKEQKRTTETHREGLKTTAKGKDLSTKINPRLDTSKKETPKTIDKSKLRESSKRKESQDKNLEDQKISKDSSQTKLDQSKDMGIPTETGQKDESKMTDQQKMTQGTTDLSTSQIQKQEDKGLSKESTEKKDEGLKTELERSKEGTTGEMAGDKDQLKSTVTKSKGAGLPSYLRPTSASMSRQSKAGAQEEMKTGSQEDMKKGELTKTPRSTQAKKKGDTSLTHEDHKLTLKSKEFTPRRSFSPNRTIKKLDDKRRKSFEPSSLKMTESKGTTKKDQLGVIQEKETKTEDKTQDVKETPRKTSTVKLGRFAAPTEASKHMSKEKGEGSKTHEELKEVQATPRKTSAVKLGRFAAPTEASKHMTKQKGEKGAQEELKEGQTSQRESKTTEGSKIKSTKPATMESRTEKIRPSTARAKENVGATESNVQTTRPTTSEGRGLKARQANLDKENKRSTLNRPSSKKDVTQDRKSLQGKQKEEPKDISKPKENVDATTQLPETKEPAQPQPLQEKGVNDNRGDKSEGLDKGEHSEKTELKAGESKQ